MVVGVLRIELHIPQGRSLKDKRQVVKSLAHRISHRFNVSVSEIDFHDLWQRGSIAVAHVSTSRTDAEKLLNNVAKFAESNYVEVVRFDMRYFNPEEDEYYER